MLCYLSPWLLSILCFDKNFITKQPKCGKGQEDPGLKDQTQKDPDPKDHGPKDPQN